MYVGRVMHSDLVTIAPETSLVEAKTLLENRGIEHLLVVDGHKHLLGIVSDKDVKKNWASPATTFSKHELNYLLSKVPVKTIMTKKLFTIEPSATVERAAYVMKTNKVSALPVLEGDCLVGIITRTDVMDVLLTSIGIAEDRGARVIVLVEDRIGTLAEVTSLLRDQQVNISSIMSWPLKEYPRIYMLILRLEPEGRARAVSTLEDNGYRVVPGYVEDLGPYLPKAAAR